MKIEPRQVEAFLKKPDPRIRAVVIYGNDDGLIAERAMQLARSVCEDLKDPFRVVDITGETLKHDPARLADEFSAMSLMGGRRVVRVRPAGEESATALENLVAATAGDALIVVEGGNLTPRSSLRTLAETEPCLAAMPCYMDSAEALEGLVENAARAQGLAVDPDALPWIVERLGGDRGQTRSEIEKLLLDFFPDATDALVYNHDVFDKDYTGDRTEDQANKNPGVNARYATLVHNDLNDNSGRVRCRELLTKNLRNFGREQHYTEEEADAKMQRRFVSINLA